MSELSIWRPRDLPTSMAILNGTRLQTVDYMRAFVREYATGQTAEIALSEAVNEMVREIGNFYVDDWDRSIRLLYELNWKIDFYQAYRDNLTSMGVFVTFTAVSRQATHPSINDFLRLKAQEHQNDDPPLECESFRDGIACVRGFWLNQSRSSVTSQPVALTKLADAKDAPAHWKPHYRMTPWWAELIVRDFYPSLEQKKEQVVSEQENNGIKYYTRAQFGEFLREHSANDELVDNLKFIEEKTAMWSKHLVLNTHKKQTEDTPRYSVENGPGILTVTLERGDLDEGERAPKLQMFFADYGKDGIAVRPRLEGSMVTTRMLDSFAQITKELQAGRAVIFTTLEQIVTFVTQVADHEGTVKGFRQELGDPEQALAEAGVPNSTVYFRMQKKDDGEVEVEALGRGDAGEDDTLLKRLVLGIESQNGGFVLAMSAESRQATFEREQALSERGEAWNEVRDVKPTPDEAVGTTTEEARALLAQAEELVEAQSPDTVGAENVMDTIVHAQPIRAIKDVEVIGNDEYMLDHFIERLLVSLISERDKRALIAFRQYILDGEGLANVDNWGFQAALRDAGASLRPNFLRDGNNAYIVIYDRAVKLGQQQSPALALYQCKVDVE